MTLVDYVDVSSLLVRGKVVDGNNHQILLVEVSNSQDEKTVLAFTGGMAHSLRQMINSHVTGETDEERSDKAYAAKFKTKSEE